MASGSSQYAGINKGRSSRAGKAGKGKPSAAKQRQAKIAKDTIKKNGGNIF